MGTASIRPRLFSRGNNAARSACLSLAWLQFGHGSSAVETWRLPRAAPPRSRAASIRPRLFSRGNQRIDDGTLKSLRASIRPRLFSRGNIRATSTTSTRPPCFNSATALQPWKPVIVLAIGPQQTMLQFGHGSSAVETQPYTPFPVAMLPASIRPRLFSRGNITSIKKEFFLGM